MILAAVLNKVYSFSDPFGSLWTYWYVRESSTALLVANLPFVWALWKRVSGGGSVTGVSGPTAHSLDEHLSRTRTQRKESNANKFTKALSPWDVDIDEIDFDKPPSALPMRTRHLNLQEVLEDANPVDAGAKQPTPYTHPQLFYGGRQFPDPPAGTLDRALDRTWDTAVLRRKEDLGVLPPEDSDEPSLSDRRGSATSINMESMTSRKSPGSFV